MILEIAQCTLISRVYRLGEIIEEYILHKNKTKIYLRFQHEKMPLQIMRHVNSILLYERV